MKLCGFEVGLDRPFFLISGPCVVESEQLQMDVAGRLKEITASLGIPFIFKSSYDKANRSSGTSFRGPGMERGLEILAKVRRELAVPVLTDVHDESQIEAVAAVVDVLQTPAFLCRQTDFIRAVAQSGKPVNIKKGQFLAPHDMKNVIDKARAAALDKGLSPDVFMACERGGPSCARPVLRWCSTPRTACSCRAARAPARAASASSCRCCRAPPWRWAWRGCSWRRTPTLRGRCPTAPTPCRCGT
ncbi:MAG: hypothetical protein RLZZ341_480 [Pseudomonadota bacterium]